MGENLSLGVCKQQRRRPACASVQTDQHLCYWLTGMYHIKQFQYSMLVYVAEETGLSVALSETPKTGFVASQPICVWFRLQREKSGGEGKIFSRNP